MMIVMHLVKYMKKYLKIYNQQEMLENFIHQEQ